MLSRVASWLKTFSKPRARRSSRGFQDPRSAEWRSPESLESRCLLSGATAPQSTSGTTSPAGFTTSQIQHLNYKSFHLLNPDQVRLLTPAQIHSIPNRDWFRTIDYAARRSLTPDQIPALNVRQTGLSGLKPMQIQWLTREQVRSLRPRDWDRLAENQIPSLREASLSRIDNDQFSALSDSQRAALTKPQVRSLNVSHVSIRLLNDSQIAVLTKAQRDAVPTADRPWLQPRQHTQLEYLGYISVPDIPFDPATYAAGKEFGYSTGAFTYIPEHNSFLLSGHVYGQLVAEISNPGPGGTATLLHDFVDVTQGALEQQSTQTPHPVLINSLLYDNGRVLVSTEQYYNVQGTQILTHGSFSPNLDDPQFSGWWGVGDWTGQATGFYMTTLPEQYAVDGKTLLTGGSVSWRSGSSAGPGAILVDPSQAAPGERLDAQTLLYYQHDPVARDINLNDPNDRGVSAYAGGVDGWLGNNDIGGVTVIGNRLVYFGRQGEGYDYYGPPDAYEQQTGLSEAYGGKGYHSGPYQASLWIYNLDGLENGNPSVQRIDFPWALNARADLRNAVLVGDLLYVVETSAGNYGTEPVPVIHVLRVHTQIGQAPEGYLPHGTWLALPDPVRD